MGRGRHWSPRYIVACKAADCDWWGVRVRSSMAKACPRCGDYRPRELNDDELTQTQRLKLQRSR